MSNVVSEVLEAVSDAMHGGAAFNDIKLFLRGEHPFVAAQYFPLCEIVVTNEAQEPRTTGAYYRRITGYIRFSVRTQDIITPTARQHTLASYENVYTYVQEAKDLFSTADGRALFGVALTGGGVVEEFEVLDSVEYGLGERNNNYENQAVVGWTCLTKEPL